MLLLDQLCTLGVERQARGTVPGIGDLDRRRLVLNDAPVGRANDGRILPFDLPLIERGQRLGRLGFDFPLEQQLRGSFFLTAIGCGTKRVERQLESFSAQGATVLLVNWL